MEGFFLYFLVFMFFLGIAQLLWGIIHPIITKNKDLRRHYGFYWMGVLAYAIGMSPAYFMDGYHGPFHSIIVGWLVGFFFIGAWGLAIYQVVIIAKKGKFGDRAESQIEVDDLRSISG